MEKLVEHLLVVDSKHLAQNNPIQFARTSFIKRFTSSCLIANDPSEFLMEVHKILFLLSSQTQSVIEDLELLQLKNISKKICLSFELHRQMIKQATSRCTKFFNQIKGEQAKRRPSNKNGLCTHCKKVVLLADLQKKNVPVLFGITDKQQQRSNSSQSSIQEHHPITQEMLQTRRVALSLQPSDAVRKLSQILNTVVDGAQDLHIQGKQLMRIGDFQQKFEQIKSKIKSNLVNYLQKTFVTMRKQKQETIPINYPEKLISHQHSQTTSWQIEQDIKNMQIKRDAMSKALNRERSLRQDLSQQLKDSVRNLQITRAAISSLQKRIFTAQYEIETKKQIIGKKQQQIQTLEKDLHQKTQQRESAVKQILSLKQQIFHQQITINCLNQKLQAKNNKTGVSMSVQTNKLTGTRERGIQVGFFIRHAQQVNVQSNIFPKDVYQDQKVTPQSVIGKIRSSIRQIQQESVLKQCGTLSSELQVLQQIKITQKTDNKYNSVVKQNIKPKGLETKNNGIRITNKIDKQQRRSTIAKQSKKQSKMGYDRMRSSNDANILNSNQVHNSRPHNLKKMGQNVISASSTGALVTPSSTPPTKVALNNSILTLQTRKPDQKSIKMVAPSLRKQYSAQKQRDTLFKMSKIPINKIDYPQFICDGNKDIMCLTTKARFSYSRPKNTIQQKSQSSMMSLQQSKVHKKDFEQFGSSMVQDTKPQGKSKLKLNIKSYSKPVNKPSKQWTKQLNLYEDYFYLKENDKVQRKLRHAYSLYVKIQELQKVSLQKYVYLQNWMIDRFYHFQKNSVQTMVLFSVVDLVGSHLQSCDSCSECPHLVQFEQFVNSLSHKTTYF